MNETKIVAWVFAAFCGPVLALMIFSIGYLVWRGDPVKEDVTTYYGRVISINPPKHFYANIQLDNGQILTQMARSKHCSYWDKPDNVGKRISIQYVVRYWKNGDSDYYWYDNNINDLLCGRP